jgi:hypothetical protein
MVHWISRLPKKTLNQVSRKSRLIEMNKYSILSEQPKEMDTNKTVDDSHEVDLTAFTEEMAEKCLHLRVLREANNIVNIEPQREWGQRRGSCGISRVNYTAGVKTWVLQRRAKTN